MRNATTAGNCGDRIRTCDLEVMSLASYRAAPPRVMYGQYTAGGRQRRGVILAISHLRICQPLPGGAERSVTPPSTDADRRANRDVRATTPAGTAAAAPDPSMPASSHSART